MIPLDRPATPGALPLILDHGVLARVSSGVAALRAGVPRGLAFAALALGLVLRSPGDAAAQCFPDMLLQTIPNPAPAANDEFGSVSISGNRVLVGARLDDADGGDSGRAYVIDATTGALLATLGNPDPAIGDRFGYAVGLSGNVAVVGAYLDDAGATDSGTAYVFNATTGAFVATLANPSPGVGDRFGFAVAVSGNVAVVGAYRDDAGASDAGRAYLFDATTGALLRTLGNPAPAAGDEFGRSVAISGNVVVVGANMDDAGATDAGTAYVFNATTGANVTTLNNPAPAAGDAFGWSVAISGNVAVIGAYLDDAGGTDSGTAYVFNATTGTPIATLNNPAPAPGDGFGRSVAISGNVAVVGAYQDDASASDAGTAYVFHATTGTLAATLSDPEPAAGDNFGSSVAVSGIVAAIGSPSDDAGGTNSGISHTFSCTPPTPSPSPSPSATPSPSPSPTRSPSPSPSPSPTPSPTSTPPPCFPDTFQTALPKPAPAPDDQHGVSVAVSGSFAVVGADRDDAGAVNAGTAYVLDAGTGSLQTMLINPAPAANDGFGISVAVSGNVVVVGADRDDAGATNAGSAYVFFATTGALAATLANPAPAAGDGFGVSVALSGDLAVVGASLDDAGAFNSGTAYVFDATTGALVTTLNNPTPSANDQFGISVAISGNLAVVGAWADDTGASNAGSAYVFDAMTGALVATLANPAPAADDGFGSSVAIAGTLAVVGAPFADVGGPDTGAPDAGVAHVFDASGALVATLNNPDPGDDDRFGVSVAITGGIAVVGASQDDAGGFNTGTAYVFDATTGALGTTLGNPSPAGDDRFGASVAIAGNVAAVGAPSAALGATTSGRAYSFTCLPFNGARGWTSYE